MELQTNAQRTRLLANGKMNATLRARGFEETDHEPVVKLFTPWTGATWLLSEIDPHNPDIAFGLCDLGLGAPELGNVSLAELMGLRGPLGLAVERDLSFRADKTLLAYAEDARVLGFIAA